MTSEEARAWLVECTVGEINKLLEGWSTQMWTTENSNDRTIPYLVIIRGSASFGEAVDREVSPMYPAANALDALIFAMARAIAAGEMEISTVATTVVCGIGAPWQGAAAYGHARCNLKAGHRGPYDGAPLHRDATGVAFEIINGYAVPVP